MKLKRLGHVAISVQNVEQAAEFYQNLGMEVVWKEADWAYLKAGEDGLALLSPSYSQAGPHFGFVFSDRTEMETAYNRLKATGVSVSGIHEHRDGTASFYGRDPDGNAFEYLYEPVPATSGFHAEAQRGEISSPSPSAISNSETERSPIDVKY